MTTTIIMVVAGFSYYYFGYVKGKEDNLNEMGFRVLSQLGANIIAKKQNVTKNAKNVVRAEIRNKGGNTESIDADDLNENSKNSEVYFTSGLTSSDHSSSYYPEIKEEFGTLKVTDTIGTSSSKVAFSFNVNLEEFSYPILHYDLFDDFMYIDQQDSIIHFNTFASGFELENLDSLLGKSQGLHVSTIKNVKIGGVNYQLFLQPQQIAFENSWIICGFIQQSKYNRMRMGVSPIFIMFTFLFTALTLLSIPFLKLWMMSSLERLNLLDAIFVVFSLMVGTSILVLLIMHSYRFYGPNQEKDISNLEAFGQNIANEFINEIKASYEQLSDFDSIFYNNSYDSDQKHDVVLLDNVSNISGIKEKVVFDSLSEPQKAIRIKASNYPLFDQMFWADKSGMQQIKWTTKKEITNKIDISKRDYFLRNLTNDAWKLEDFNFSIESIYSWNTGKSMVGLGTRSKQFSDSAVVVALSSVFYSVIDPIIPQGHAYAIIDDKGDVWFHSDKTRNLQENIFEETEMNPRLRSSIYARGSTSLTLKYHGENYQAYVCPIKSIPLYMIVMYNQEYGKTTKAQIINFSLLHMFLFFLFFLIMVILSNFVQATRSKLKKKEIFFAWLWPLEKNKNSYHEIFFVNVFIAILLFLFTSFADQDQSVALLYVAAMISYFHIYIRLKFGIEGKKVWRNQFLFSLAIAGGLLIIIVYSLIKFYWFILILILLLGILFLIPRKRIFTEFVDTRKSYSLMWVSWIFIVSVIPSVLFYRISYNQEKEIEAKHGQLYMAKEIASKSSLWEDGDQERKYCFSKNNGDKHDFLERGDIYGSHLFDKIYITSSKSSKKSFARKKRDSPATEKIDFYALLASKIRPYYNDIVVQNNSLGYESPKDSLWWWAKNDKLNLVYSNFVVDSYSEDSVIVVESHIPSFHLPVFFRNEVMHSSEVFYWYNPINFISWAFFVSLVLCLYALIKFATKHIFASNIINSNSHDIEDKLFRVDEERKNVFLIGLPKCGKTQFLHEKFPQEHNKLVINLIEVFYEDSWDDLFKKASNSDIDIIIIDHFEFNLENKDLTQKKLELLEKFLLLPKKKIIVSTSVHLSIIKELYSMKRNKERDDEAIYRWVELFKNFYEVYFPLQGFGPYNKKVRKFSKQSQAINNLLETEFNHGHYLEELRPEIEKLIERNEQNDITSDHDHIIMKIQSLCSVYYHLLWSTCTENEKYIIYDLAEDGLVNTKNFETIELLLNKGLIVFKDSLQVMNASFRNFVLTKIGPFEAIQMERKANKSGTWTMFRNPMIIILLAIAGFLVFTQQDTIHTALSFLTPLLALLPALIKIFGMIGSKKASSGSDDN